MTIYARDATPQTTSAVAAEIVERCTALRPELARAEALEHRVGLKPGGRMFAWKWSREPPAA